MSFDNIRRFLRIIEGYYLIIESIYSTSIFQIKVLEKKPLYKINLNSRNREFRSLLHRMQIVIYNLYIIINNKFTKHILSYIIDILCNLN